tara:strand:+ start:1260 stop:1946 length:687 start_codon:yes stop_codon:yes gene_type:complete
MRLKEKNNTQSQTQISEQEYQAIVKSEFVKMLQEEFGDEVLEEGFFDNLLKGAGKKTAGYVQGIGKAYINVFKAYTDLLGSVFGIQPDDPKAPDVAEPEEMAKDIAGGDTEGAADDIADIEDTVKKAAAKADNDEDKKKASAISKELDKIEKALEKPPEELEDKESASASTDSDALLDVLDKIIDDWDKIQASTKDKSLKKAMDYIEKVAMAEMMKYKKELISTKGDK